MPECFLRKIEGTDITVRCYYDITDKQLHLDFDKEFYAHKEVCETIKYEIDKFRETKATDLIMHYLVDQISKFLAVMFKMGTANLDHFDGCITIQRGF